MQTETRARQPGVDMRRMDSRSWRNSRPGRPVEEAMTTKFNAGEAVPVKVVS